jgi:hypothetical protein
MSFKFTKYVVTHSGGLAVREPFDAANYTTVLPENTVFDAISQKVDGLNTYLQLATGGWVVYKRGTFVSCKVLDSTLLDDSTIVEYKVIYAGGLLIKRSPTTEATASTGKVLGYGTIFDAYSEEIMDAASGSKFIKLSPKSSANILSGESEFYVMCKLPNGEPTAAKRASLVSHENSKMHPRGSKVGLQLTRPGIHTNSSAGEIPTVADLCGDDLTPVVLAYAPQNPTYQISKLGHYAVYRKGIYNDSDAITNNNVVYSVEGVPVELSVSAITKINHVYNGEPLLVTIHERVEVCGACCFDINCDQHIKCCFCCDADNSTMYNDDGIQVKGFWFGRSNAQRKETCCSGLGGTLQLPPGVLHTLVTLGLKPPTQSKCSCFQLCTGCLLQEQAECIKSTFFCCAPSPPLINHISIDASDCKLLVATQPRILTSLAATANNSNSSSSGVITNPLITA